ncbi:MAG: hypothetical protein K9N05_03985 [Candidatus Marinimicrobia bacterium]|nr:hypothetical protein [Candidatus Neomarinimicrobiota bacterium]
MKKIFIFLAVLCVLLSSCFSPEPQMNTEGETYYYLADTNGTPGTSFHSGESFYVKFCLTNTTEDSLDFTMYNGGPFVRFSIYQDDQYIAGSMDGLGVHEPVLYLKFAPGDSMTSTWLAPTTPWQEPKVTLSPGTYRVHVVFPQFDVLQTYTLANIIFTITQ